MPAVPAIIGAVGAIGAAKLAGDAQKKAAATAANSASANAPGTVNIAELQRQAQGVAQENAANSAALERLYNPGAQELRASSLQSVLAGLPRTPETERLSQLIMAQAGNPLSGVAAPSVQQFDSGLTRSAVDAAAADLALGGELPQDVRNLVARQALAKSGMATGGLSLGRDLVARDLGLTSLDLRNKRLQNAASVAAQEAALNQANAVLRQQNQALGLQASGLNMDAERFGRTNLFDSASFLQNVGSGDFNRALAAAGLGQNIAAPMSGLDPGSIVNLAVGNSNNSANAAQNAAAIQAQAGNQKAALFGQLAGVGAGLASNYFNTPKTTTTLPTTTIPSNTVAPSYFGPVMGSYGGSTLYQG